MKRTTYRTPAYLRPGFRRNGNTYRLVFPVGGHAGTYLREEDTDTIHGPFGSLQRAEDWVRQHGGGWLEWGSGSQIIPDVPPNQIPLLRFFHGAGLGWRDYMWAESHPLA